MAKATVRKAPVGKSSNIKDSKTSDAAKLGKLHSSAKTAPTFNSARMDKLEGKSSSGTGGVKS